MDLRMAISDDFTGVEAHVGLLPSAGMGHLTPFLRLAHILIRRNCKLTLITTHPAVSLAESRLISRFLSAFPQVNELELRLLPLEPAMAASEDPFFVQFEAIRRSAHLLSPLLTTLSPPLSILVSDVSLISSTLMVTESLKLPNFILFSSSAKMFCLFAYYHLARIPQTGANTTQSCDFIHIPGVGSIPKTSLPPFLLTDSLFRKIFMQDGQKVKELSGILMNTFDGLEEDLLTTLNSGEVLDGLPPVTAVGPLPPCEFENQEFKAPMKWLDDSPPRSVVFANFGSRTALSRDQIKEFGNGLISSGYKFLWVLKDKIVDKEDEDGLDEILGKELIERMSENGMVVKNWVNQAEILAHRAIGGFISHCGWNSVMEAALNGVKILAWPQIGDQKVNAEVIAKKGLGMWVESWGWGKEVLLKGEEIGKWIQEMMESEALSKQSAELGEQARKAVGVGGSSDRAIEGLIEKWKNV